MDHPVLYPEHDHHEGDRSAILMMLAYVEAECRRLGSLEAARHAAIAATLVQVAKAPECAAQPGANHGLPLH